MAGNAQDVWQAGQQGQGLLRLWDVARGNWGMVVRLCYTLMGTVRALLTILVSMLACHFEPCWVCCGSARPDVIHHIPCLSIL